ncbi:MAG TPA: FHA domain-containing protein [Planctomycetaceae bacterium]|jgi:DNA-binding CsgD family transcriptional regulator
MTADSVIFLSPFFCPNRLVMVNVPDQEWSYTIGSERKVLGRSLDAAIQIPMGHRRVSRRHATVWRNDSNIWMRDEGSKFGTLVNGVFLKSGQPANITVGDRIGLANVELEVVDQVSKLAKLLSETGINVGARKRSGKGTKTVSIHLRPLDVVRIALERLTSAELDILLWMYRGYTSDAELGRRLCRSPHTIRTQVASIHAKLGVHSRADVATWLKRSAPLRSDPEQFAESETILANSPASRRKARSAT